MQVRVEGAADEVERVPEGQRVLFEENGQLIAVALPPGSRIETEEAVHTTADSAARGGAARVWTARPTNDAPSSSPTHLTLSGVLPP